MWDMNAVLPLLYLFDLISVTSIPQETQLHGDNHILLTLDLTTLKTDQMSPNLKTHRIYIF